jgi:dCMP deaminase
MSDERPSWDEWAIIVAAAVSLRADCRRSRVGAVILDTSHRIVSTGYNGTAPGEPGCLLGSCPRGLASLTEVPAYSRYDSGAGSCIAVHAEISAIQDAAPGRLRGSSIYVTREPCRWCDQTIVDAGIARIVWPSDHGIEERVQMASKLMTTDATTGTPEG